MYLYIVHNFGSDVENTYTRRQKVKRNCNIIQLFHGYAGNSQIIVPR